MSLKVTLASILAALMLFANINLTTSQASPAQPLLVFEVNVTQDGNDLNLGDAICDALAEAGEQCTLRAAVQEANELSGAQEIILPAGTYLLVGGAGEDDSVSGDLDIKGDLTIHGAGMDATFVDGGGNDRVFQIHQSVNVTIDNLTVRHGSAENGGGIAASFTNLTLNNIQVINNTATGVGGGISLNGSTSSIMINNCDVLSNTAVIAGGGIYNQEPKLDVVESRVSYNQTTANGSAGGGMYLKWSNNTVTRSTISYNSSVDNGGGIFIDSNSKLAVILDSTISHNSTARGGGLYSIGGEIVVGNSTISNNYATSRGGGVYTDNSFPAEVTIEFFSVTIYSNRVGSIDGSAGDGGGLYNVDSSISMKNGILAGNNRGRLFPIDDDCYGVLESQDYNLIEETEGCTITGSTTHDQTGVNPMLDFLVDNGGPTRTRMPQPGSPVIDKGNPAGCTDTDGAMLATDQRGYARTVDGDGVGGAICDIGAVEFALNPVPTLTSLNPDSTQAGGNDFILTVNGSEFVDGAVVQWKGTARATTFISKTQLSAQINAADIASQGSASITVLNPEPGGGVSNALTFSITAPAGGGYKIYLPIVDR